MEKWKDIKGFEGLYQISSQGRIKSFLSGKWKLRSIKDRSGDYLRINLYKGKGRETTKSVHRLVAEAFIPNPNKYPCINHIDMNKQNNNIENLEWCSYKENNKKAREQKPQIIVGIKKYNRETKPKKICQFTLDGAFVSEYINAHEASLGSGVCERNILQVASKTPYNSKGSTRKQAGGFVWIFKEEVI